MIQEKSNIPLVLVTMGKAGSRAYYKGMIVEVATLSFRKTPLRLPVQEILSVQVLSITFWSMVWITLQKRTWKNF